jgi:drug/metabolite transporter (DMT)-like permease
VPTAWKGLLVGGLVPALLFGITGTLQKVYGRAGGGAGWYLPLVGLGVAATGLMAMPLLGERALTARAGAVALAIGASWGLGMIAVIVGLGRFGAPLSKLAPLYNLNTLVVVLLALVLFAESREVNAPRLLAGAALIVAGGALVARA